MHACMPLMRECMGMRSSMLACLCMYCVCVRVPTCMSMHTCARAHVQTGTRLCWKGREDTCAPALATVPSRAASASAARLKRSVRAMSCCSALLDISASRRARSSSVWGTWRRKSREGGSQ